MTSSLPEAPTIPEVFRPIVVDEHIKEFYERTQDLCRSVNKPMQVELLTSYERRMLLGLGKSAVGKINNAFDTFQTETLSTVLPVATKPVDVVGKSARRILYLGVADDRLQYERDTLVWTINNAVNDIPPIFDKFHLGLVFGRIHKHINRDRESIVNSLEPHRPDGFYLSPGQIPT